MKITRKTINMRHNRYIFLISFLALTFGTYVGAANTLKVRLVEAYNSTGEASVSPGLQDVAAMLKKNLRYNSLSLLGNTTVSLPAKTPVTIDNYTLSIKGIQKNLSVKVSENNKIVFQSKVRLKPNSPVIFGGFKGRKGKIMFIFNLLK